jgi:hypothetical protein
MVDPSVDILSPMVEIPLPSAIIPVPIDLPKPEILLSTVAMPRVKSEMSMPTLTSRLLIIVMMGLSIGL